MVMADLAPDFATGPFGAVDVDIGRTGTNCAKQLVEFAGVQSLIPRR